VEAEADSKNAMKIEDPKISELPFEYQITFRSEASNNNFWWKFGRHHWNGYFENQLPVAVHLPKERLLLLEK